jgi:hypothetical protein
LCASNQNLIYQLLIASPLTRKTNPRFCFCHVADLLVTSGSQQGQFGTIGMVLQLITGECAEAFPVTELPLGTRAIQQAFIVRNEL